MRGRHVWFRKHISNAKNWLSCVALVKRGSIFPLALSSLTRKVFTPYKVSDERFRSRKWPPERWPCSWMQEDGDHYHCRLRLSTTEWEFKSRTRYIACAKWIRRITMKYTPRLIKSRLCLPSPYTIRPCTCNWSRVGEKNPWLPYRWLLPRNIEPNILI